MKAWGRIEPTEITKVGWRNIFTKTFTMPDGSVAQFQTIGSEGSHRIATIALTPDRQVIIASQFRPGPEEIIEELPGGGVDSNDADFAAAARRELREETGYVADEIIALGDIFGDAYTNTTWHYFLGMNCSKDPKGQYLDNQEYVEVGSISIDDLLKNARQGRMTDIAAVFLAYNRLLSIKEETNE